MANKTRLNDELEIPRIEECIVQIHDKYYINAEYVTADGIGFFLNNEMITYNGIILLHNYDNGNAYLGFKDYENIITLFLNVNNIVEIEGKPYYEIKIIFNHLTSEYDFDSLVSQTPTNVQLVEDEGKLQLQLMHDSDVLSIDEGFNELLGSKVGYSINNSELRFTGNIWLENDSNDHNLIISFHNASIKINDKGFNIYGEYLEDVIIETTAIFFDACEFTDSEIFYSGLLSINGDKAMIGNASVNTWLNKYWKISGYELVNSKTGEYFAV